MSATPSTSSTARRRMATSTDGFPSPSPSQSQSQSQSQRASKTDPNVLAQNVQELEQEVRELRRQIQKERERRRTASQRKREKERAASYTTIDMHGKTEEEIRNLLTEKLKQVDDDTLTALLTASIGSLVRSIGGGDTTSTMLAIDPLLVPSKSVGIEGTGSGADIDRRLLQAASSNYTSIDLSSRRGKHQLDTDSPDSDQLQDLTQHAKQARSLQQWLKERRQRTDSLLTHLTQFTYFHLDSLTQQSSSSSRRRIKMRGNMAGLFPLDLSFDILDSPSSSTSSSSPQLSHLVVHLPSSVESLLNKSSNHLTRILSRNDLPTLFLSLRSMLPLLHLRRSLFFNLVKEYKHLTADFIQQATEINYSTNPSALWQPQSSHRTIDPQIASSFIDPSIADTLVFQTKPKVSLTLTFSIRFNRFGHAFPKLDMTPSIPPSPSVTNLVDTFSLHFHQLVEYVTQTQPHPHDASSNQTSSDSPATIQQDLVGISSAIMLTVNSFFGVK